MRTKIHSLIVVLLYILSGCLQAVMGQGGGSPQNVVWTNLVNVTATGNTLQKTSGCDGCADAGATSEQAIASGDGYFEFTVPSVAGQRFAGLRNGNGGTGWQEIDSPSGCGGRAATWSAGGRHLPPARGDLRGGRRAPGGRGRGRGEVLTRTGH